MDNKDDAEVEQIIPISLQADDYNARDDDSDPIEVHQTDQHPNYTFSNINYGHYESTWNQRHNGGVAVSGLYPGLYHQMPPTINIFACPPPPPPPHYGFNGRHAFRPPVLHSFDKVHLPQHGFACNIPSNMSQQGRQESHNSSGVQTPPPPQLSTPFHCEEVRPTINPGVSHQGINIERAHCNKSPSPVSFRRLRGTRFHPYQSEPQQTHVKREPEVCFDQKHFLCVDTHDFNASELSIKVRDNKLTIEGTKLQTNSGRLSSMKQEFTFRNKSDAKNTSCTLHTNGTLILQFNNNSRENEGNVKCDGSVNL